MFVAEACVLVWGLVLALLRLGRGRLTAPLRWLTIGYIDLFRAIPGLVLIYMIGFGIPIAGVPWLSDWSQYSLAVLALTILYGAYVAEVYRAGIESIHWSQTAAARSLGLSRARRCASWSCPRPPGGSSRRCSTTSSAPPEGHGLHRHHRGPGRAARMRAGCEVSGVADGDPAFLELRGARSASATTRSSTAST